MLDSNLDKVKEKGCRQRFARVRDVENYKGKGLLRVNEGGKYKVEGKTSKFLLQHDFERKLTIKKLMSKINL